MMHPVMSLPLWQRRIVVLLASVALPYALVVTFCSELRSALRLVFRLTWLAARKEIGEARRVWRGEEP